MPSTDITPALARLPAEARLLLASAGGRDFDAMIRSLINAPIDWGRLCRLAIREQAWPVLYYRLQALGAIPDPVSGPLASLAAVAEGRQHLLQTRLRQAVETLNHIGVHVTLLKGAALARTAYADPMQRPMADIDLLVEPSRAKRAQQALLDDGWKPAAHAREEVFYHTHHHLVPLEDSRGTGLGLELHEELFPHGPFQFSAEQVRSEARDLVLDCGRVAIPSPVHQLLHAALHFSWSHFMSRSAWRTFRDIEALNSAGLVDWDLLVRAARQSRGGSCSYWALRLAAAVAGADIRPDVLRRLRPFGWESGLRRLERHLVLGLLPSAAACPSVTASRWLWRSAVLPRWSGHGRYLPWQGELDTTVKQGGRPRGTFRRRIRRAIACEKYVWELAKDLTRAPA